MNISSLKTPGVYINEIDAFPPSVANVATAIPAFIGYTEKGPTIPTRISSMLEYEQIYGGAPQPSNITIDLDENNLPKDSSVIKESIFKMYNSLQLFYGNGGGICYILSIGNYLKPDKTINSISQKDYFKNGDSTVGIGKLEKFDEPTLLLFPDGVNNSEAEPDKALGEIQKQALAQCEKLMDRFVIMDVMQKVGLTDDSEKFRAAIGTNNLKYGAAYYPYLQIQSNSSFAIKFRDINGSGIGKINFKGIYSSNNALKVSIENFEKLQNDFDTILQKWNPTPVPADNANNKIIDNLPIDSHAKLDAVYNKCWGLLKTLGNPADANFITGAGMKNYVNELISINLKNNAQELVDFKKAYEKLKQADGVNEVDDLAALDNDTDFKEPWGNISTYEESNPNPFDNEAISKAVEAVAAIPAHKEPDFNKIQQVIQKLHSKILNAMVNVMNTLKKTVSTEESILTGNIPNYSTIISKLSQSMNTVPPSGAIAGIYALTDALRGVWKTPANITVNGIVGLTVDINDADQENMNIHETGKSINAIRKFYGKDILVWGGRTLAGNNNDWRYVNVRRLANMIEESVKKACRQYMFEPNVAQTWINIKGMIENYLTTLWNDGALAGAKPEEAFFVQVGLNQTMRAQDILEGRLIVKIGYAPSRPAEFIILEFKQMQQRS